jgi:hypothetical protein
MGPLYSSVAFVYDALCFTFYIGAFAYYIQIRREGRVLNRRQTAVFLLLYLFALNSKEMALTMPLMLLVYEWMFHSPPPLRGLRAWLTGPGRTIVLSGALNLVFLYGKVAGVEPLLDIPAYRPKLSMHRFWVFHKGAFGALLGEWASLPWTGVAALWLILLYLAFRRREAIPRFSWMFMFLTPLPIQFLLGRGQACLYVTLAGWAVFLAVMFRKLAEAFARDLQRSPLGRWFRERQIFAAACATGLVLWGIMVQVRKESDVTPLQQRTGPITNYVIGQFRELNARPAHGSTVVFLSDPFVDWDMLFIAELAFNDRSLRILPARKVPVSSQELAEARAVFDWRDNKLVQVRP